MKSRLNLLPSDILNYIYKLAHKMNTKNIIFEFNSKINNARYYHILQEYGQIIKSYQISEMYYYVDELDFIDSCFRHPSKFKYM